MSYTKQTFNWLVNLIFPIRCVGCGTLDMKRGNRHLCRSCRAAIPIGTGAACIGCERPSPRGATCIVCRQSCPIDHLLSVTEYKNLIARSTVKGLKFRFVPDLAVPIALLMQRYLKRMSGRGWTPLDDNPLVVPVPLTARRLNWRGFNQSELIATLLSNHFLLACAPSALSRVKHTTPQADIKDADERKENAAGLFVVAEPEKVRGRAVLLIDDVCTTGATLNECAKVLKAAGAEKVSGLVFARG